MPVGGVIVLLVVFVLAAVAIAKQPRSNARESTRRASRLRRRFGKPEVIGLIALAGVIGLILLLRFRYPDRVCVRWESGVVPDRSGVPDTKLICAEYQDQRKAAPP